MVHQGPCNGCPGPGRGLLIRAIAVKDGQAVSRRLKGSPGGRAPAFDALTYHQRNAVAHRFSRLKHHCGFATRNKRIEIEMVKYGRMNVIRGWCGRIGPGWL